MRLCDLESHTSADTKSGAVGDIEVVDPNRNVVFEAVEIKHNQVITVGMIRNAYGKFRSHPIDRYYILTTVEGEPIEQITDEVIRIQKEHGCQVIVNGVFETLKYYLRLLKTPAEFVSNYVSLVEKDPALKYEHKVAWDSIINNNSLNNEPQQA